MNIVGILLLLILSPIASAADCKDDLSGETKKLCVNVALIHLAKTAGQSLDEALLRNKGIAKGLCGQGWYAYRLTPPDVTLISQPIGSIAGPVVSVEVREQYVCGPW